MTPQQPIKLGAKARMIRRRKMKENMKYVIENMTHNGNVVDWIMCIEAFFGKEQTEKFCEYYINAHQIISKSDIRNIIPTHTLSIYWCMENEQIAFISIYAPINNNIGLIKNRENGMQRAQEFYRRKAIEFSKKIKKLGYSYEAILGNWKDKNEKDTYQREYIFAIFSEKTNKYKFINDICNLAKEYNKKEILITETIKDKGPKAIFKSAIYDTQTKKELKENENTGIEVIEKYFSQMSSTKFLFKIPYENNKNIIKLENRKISRYYSKIKQEIIKKAYVNSFNTGMLKQALLAEFRRDNYNN